MSVSLDDVLITAELARRPRRLPDYEAENRALMALAEAMEGSPQAMLRKLVEAAMELCHADSAGISILEPGGAGGVVRWAAAAGRFAPYVGRQMPPSSSPSVTVLDLNTSLLFAYPERHFSCGLASHPPVVETLIVPFEAKPRGTLWVVAHTSSRQFDSEDQRILMRLSRFMCTAYQMKRAVLTAEAERNVVAADIQQTVDASAIGLTRCSRDLRYLSVNPAYAKLARLPAEQIVGRPIIDVMGAKAFEVIRPHVERVLRGERVEFEEEVPCAAGGPKFLHVVHTPWINAAGHVDGWVASISDITNLKRATMELQEREQRLRLALDALRQNEEREAFLLQLSDALRPLSDPVAMQRVTARLLAEHLHLNRVNYADIEGADFVVRMSYANGVAPFAGRGPVATFGESLMEAYRRGDPISVNDVQADPRLTERERANLLSREVAAFAGVMLVKQKQWVAAFGVHSATPRVWKTTDLELIRDVAERMWQAVERARAEETLREREQGLRLALDASSAGIWTWDPRTNQTTWDDRFLEQHGFSKETPQTFDTWFANIHEEDRPTVLGHVDDLLHRHEDKSNIIFRFVRPDGTVAWMHAMGRAERDSDGQLIRMTGINLDITERRRAEQLIQALRDQERDQTLQLLLDTAAQGILSMDATGVIVTANRTLETMFGWGPDELTGKPVEVLLPSELRGRHATHRASYFAAPRPRPMGGGLDLVGQRKDGSRFPVEVSLNHARTITGEHAIALVTDVTARKQAEEALRQSHAALEDRTAELERRTVQLSRLASELTLAEQNTREQFAKTLHDGLQQLLFIAKLGLDRVLENGTPAADSAAQLSQVRANIDNAISASRSLSMELFPPALHVAGLPAAVKWLANWMQEKYGLMVQAVVDPLANSDRKDVRTLVFESLRELLFNAVKHAKVDRVAVNLEVGPKDTLCVTVTDQGVGFDPASVLHAPDTQKAGLGLLSIKERLMLLSGQLEIESARGQGTRFRIVVPRSPIATVASVSIPSSPGTNVTAPELVNGSVSRVRILVVDDHAGVRETLCQTLRSRPELQVVGQACDGLEAIDQARNFRPDAIVMDISMPNLDGVEATRRIHAEFPSIQIFGLSSTERTGNRHPIEDAGGVGYFVKGADMPDLIGRLLSIPTEKTAIARHAS